MILGCFFFSSRRRHTSCGRDWSSDVCSSDLGHVPAIGGLRAGGAKVPGGTFAQRAATRVDMSELSLVPERLLEVVPDNLLELCRPGPGNLEEPIGVALVQAGPGPLEQAVVGGISHQNVAELVVRAVRPHVDGPNEALAAQCRQQWPEVGLRVTVRCESRDG